MFYEPLCLRHGFLRSRIEPAFLEGSSFSEIQHEFRTKAARAAIIIVSGASKGIGKAIARALALEGVNAAMLARTESEIRAVATEIHDESGVQALGIAIDIPKRNHSD